ncbi:MAG: MauE/DoxX family redox-associated membrane protein [Gemmatimonadota bacterium]
MEHDVMGEAHAGQGPAWSPELRWIAFFARGLLGLLFLMTGWTKMFHMGPLEHARQFFVEPYAETWIPVWLLWALGTVVPFVELVSGGLLLVGLWVRRVLLTLGFLLLMVTYGHLLAEPFFDVTTHIFPRAALLLLLLALPHDADTVSLDGWRRRRA